MRFAILENSTSGYVSQEEFNDFLQKSCSEYIKQKEHWDLYRGINSHGISKSQVRFITTPDENRRPKDVHEEIHAFVDDFFFHKFGWHPRSEGVFASGSVDFASEYGNVWIIYPSNGFKFLWSPDVRDLFEEADFNRNTSSAEKVNNYLAKEVLPTYVNYDLIGAIKSGHEIMINCDQYAGEVY